MSKLIAQITDIHLGEIRIRRSAKSSAQKLSILLNTLSQLDLSCIVLTGDIIQRASSKRQAKLFHEMFSKFTDRGVPIYTTPGNHDIGGRPIKSAIEWYRENIGRDNHSLTLASNKIVIFNSVIYRPGCKLFDYQEELISFIEAELMSSNAKKKILFTHYPLFTEVFDEKTSYWNMPSTLRYKLFDLFRQHGVDAVFSGHFHRCRLNEHRGTEYVVTGPLAKAFDGTSSGFRLINLSESSIKHSYYPYDIPPQEIQLPS